MADIEVAEPPKARPVPLEGRDLLSLSREMGLSLSREELEAVRLHFRRLGRPPTDVELETVAQTWSEHCKHKTFTAPVRYVEDGRARRFRNLLKETVFEATRRLRRRRRDLLSVFEDNAGLVAFDGRWALAFKVETHNHPCALEPYGGAETGVGGVIRDVLGAGLGAKPILNTDVFCVGSPRDPGGPGRHAPLRTLRDMAAGVRDYGNRMGIPTASGGLWFDEGYRANPLVFCGTLGLLPRGAVRKRVRAGDLVVAVGGRTGRDGLHGATFSSASIEEFRSSAVQIGHAILEKRVLDALQAARERGLYRAVTDCGAGGFSSAVGEMAEGVGAEVELDRAPLKHRGMAPWEVWLSESQERMVLAVPPEKLGALAEALEAEGVEHAVLGRFTGDGRLRVRWRGEGVAELDLDFLHRGLPKRERRAEWRPAPARRSKGRPLEPQRALHRLLSHPNLASRAWLIRQYDHEVQGQTAVKPLQGRDGPGDACVVWPQVAGWRGVATACGLAPELGKLDPRLMAFAAVDECLRNLAAVGADVSKAAILDNFCWGDVEDPRELGRLVRCAVGCRDAALAYGAPFVSGKDSLNNTWSRGGRKSSIPGTLLVSGFAPLPDVRRAVTMDLKAEGNGLWLAGRAGGELGGSHYALLTGLVEPPPALVPGAPRAVRAVAGACRAGLVRACHDLSEGGLAVAAAEMSLAGGLGAVLELARLPGGLEPSRALFAEGFPRFLLEVEPGRERELRSALKGAPLVRLGTVGGGSLRVLSGGRELLDEPVEALARSHRETLPRLMGDA